MAKKLFTTLVLICALLACFTFAQEEAFPKQRTHVPETLEDKKAEAEKLNGETTTEEFWDCKSTFMSILILTNVIFCTVFSTNDPIGTMVYYLLWVLYYALCTMIAELAFKWPDKAGIRTACMNGVHNELLYAFEYQYSNPVV